MRVVVIDDGIAKNSIPLPIISYRVVDETVIPIDENKTSKHSHGTLCAKLIFKNIKDAVEIISIAAYSEYSDGNVRDLLAALKWCINKNVDIINMSNGFVGYFNNTEIAEVCNNLWSDGTTIVAAISNFDEYTMPANLPYVTSVARRRIFHRKKNHICPDIYASGLYIYRSRTGKIHIDFQNSFACAQVCNRIIKKLQKKKSKVTHSVFKEIYDFSLLRNVYSLDKYVDSDELLPFKIEPYENQQIDASRITVFVRETEITTKKCNELVALAPQIGLLVWCDSHFPLLIRRLCAENNIRYWYEFKDGIYKNSKEYPDALKGTYVILFHKSEVSFQKAMILKQLFEKDGYTVLAFSSKQKCYLYGAMYSTKVSTIKQLCYQYKPDIAIVFDDYDNFTDWDVEIQCKKDCIDVKLDKTADKQSACQDIMEVHNKIIHNVTTAEENISDQTS